MAKQSGLGDALYVSGYDLSGDIGSLQRIAGGPAALELTGINKSAFERNGGVRTGEISYSSWFNPSANQQHAVLKTLPTDDQLVTYGRGTAIGSPAACLVDKQVNYDPTRAQDGSLSSAIQALSNGYGLEWGELLTAGVRSDTGATNGSSYDAGASSAFGLQAYLHVISFTGTSCTVTIQESSDNGGADAFAAVVGGAFAAATAGRTWQRIATAAISVERYLRVATSGTFTQCSFVVAVVRNATAVAF